MSLIEYKGFGGVPLAADMLGDENDPAVLLVPEVGQDRTAWREVAEALVLSGRRVVNLGLRDDRELAPHIEDLRAVLAQMGSRPVVVAAGAAAGSRRAHWGSTARISPQASFSSTCPSMRTPLKAESQRG